MKLGDPVPYHAVKREHTRLLLAQYSIKEVAEILDIDESSLYRYRRKEQIERVIAPPPEPLLPPSGTAPQNPPENPTPGA